MQMPSYVDISILFSPRLYIFSIVGKLIKCRIASSQMTTRHCAPRHLNRIEDTAVFASRPCSDCSAGLWPNVRAKRGFDSVALTCFRFINLTKQKISFKQSSSNHFLTRPPLTSTSAAWKFCTIAGNGSDNAESGRLTCD